MFGKGPEITTVDIVGDVIIIKLEGFVTPLEQTICQHPEGAKKIDDIRDYIYTNFMPEMKQRLKDLTDKNVMKVIKGLNLGKTRSTFLS